MKPSLSTTLSFFAVLLWWFVAFKSPVANEPMPFFQTEDFEDYEEGLYCTNNLLKIEREVLVKAIRGDAALMTLLIHQWDVDSEILGTLGFENVKRLDRDDFLKSQVIGRVLCNDNEIDQFEELSRKKLVIDDLGQPFDLETPPKVLLPQTHMSTEILLALVELDRIAALPSGYRNQSTLFCEHDLSAIKLDIDRHHSERLFQCNPDIAFVSKAYSHPGVLQILNDQEIPLYHIENTESIEDVKSSIINLGNIANSSLKANLLAIFIDAAMNAIDNKRMVLSRNLSSKKVLVTYYHSQFSLPGTKTLTYHFMQRMGVVDEEYSTSDFWSTPIREEQIHNLNPDYLIIITSDTDNALNFFYSFPAFKNINAAQSRTIRVIDEYVQKSVSQNIVIAYFDLNNALVKLE